MTSTEKAHLKDVVKEILREDKSLLREIVMEIFKEEKELQKTQNIPISEQERNEKIDKIIQNDFKRYKNVFKALA
jgi:hypothetical protein